MSNTDNNTNGITVEEKIAQLIDKTNEKQIGFSQFSDKAKCFITIDTCKESMDELVGIRDTISSIEELLRLVPLDSIVVSLYDYRAGLFVYSNRVELSGSPEISKEYWYSPETWVGMSKTKQIEIIINFWRQKADEVQNFLSDRIKYLSHKWCDSEMMEEIPE